MKKVVGLGIQDFQEVIEEKNIYIDKTRFISEWWKSNDGVTLITRPRRFGKTLMLSTIENFFSISKKNNKKLYENLEVSRNEQVMEECGKWPVLFVSFASIKSSTHEGALRQFAWLFTEMAAQMEFLTTKMNEKDLDFYKRIGYDMDDKTSCQCLNTFCRWMSNYYGKKVILLIDEYDTPMQEAYVNGYWDKLVEFMRNMLNSALKTNLNLTKSLLTGITRVSRESLFSDLNNLKIVTISSDKYADCFGFTEEEVFAALDEFGYSSEKENIKKWYDGFRFGKREDIYNPWSILSFLQEGKYESYWANTSSNSLISKLVREGDAAIKRDFEELLRGGSVVTSIDEQLVFGEMQGNEIAVWSLLYATGYLKIEKKISGSFENQYELKLTNYEITRIFYQMVMRWFRGEGSIYYNEFVKALLKNDVKGMNKFLNMFLRKTCSYFDGGKYASGETEPEKFYHGLVLGLLVGLSDEYILKSNRESGYGRYDVMLKPKNIKNGKGFIIEFKVLDGDCEKTLEDTARSALKQIEERHYEDELLESGLNPDEIYKYGFAFSGKEVLIESC